MTAYNNYYDVVIVGGGPAGLSAAQILGRCRRQTILFDEGNQRNLISKAMHGFITRDGINPNEFLQIARNELAQYENFITLKLTTCIVDAKKRKEDGIFELQSKEGEVFYSNYLLLATGEQDEIPQIKNFMQFYGSTIHHCPICDGWEKCGKDVIVYGNGERGSGMALEMTTWTSNITLCTDGPAYLPQDDIPRLKKWNVIIVEDEIDSLVGQGNLLNGIRFKTGRSPIPCQTMFFATPRFQHSDLPLKLGLKLTPKGDIMCNPHSYGLTNVANLYIAGNITDHPTHFVISAAAEGAKAAFAINSSILKRDTA